MAAGILISGPAGAGKTDLAAQLRRDLPDAVIADFQQLYAALLGLIRLPSGHYPERLATDDYALALAELMRHTIIRQAREQELTPITTNSDGSPDRRAFLLNLLGPGSTERVVDPGIKVITETLASRSLDGEISKQCMEARDRWYGKLVGERQGARRG